MLPWPHHTAQDSPDKPHSEKTGFEVLNISKEVYLSTCVVFHEFSGIICNTIIQFHFSDNSNFKQIWF